MTYADENAPFAMVRLELKETNETNSAGESLSLWLQRNCMKMNPDKFYLLFSNKIIYQLGKCL